MDISTPDAAFPPAARAPRNRPRLDSLVAVTVALVSMFMGVCKVKDDNIVQAMQQAQSDRLDHWNFYQARNIRQEVAQATLVQLRLARSARAPAQADEVDRAIAQYEGLVANEARKKEELRVQAEQDQKTYDRLNFRDDQFDLSDALLSLAIAMLAVTALTDAWWMLACAGIPVALGVLMGCAGLFGWPLHPDAVVRWLS